MDWLFLNAKADLARWEGRSFSAGVEEGPHPHDHRDNHERIVGQEDLGPPNETGLARRIADAILSFDIFPLSLLSCEMRRPLAEMNDVIGLRYHFVPGLDLFFAARVYERFEESSNGLWRCGFSYRTLQGHPECGEETFVVEKNLATGQVVAALRSWSRPGIWLARLAYPLVRSLQLRAARAALDHLEELAHAETKPDTVQAHLLFAGRNLRTGLLRSDRL